jgi:hypothetical protein
MQTIIRARFGPGQSWPLSCRRARRPTTRPCPRRLSLRLPALPTARPHRTLSFLELQSNQPRSMKLAGAARNIGQREVRSVDLSVQSLRAGDVPLLQTAVSLPRPSCTRASPPRFRSISRWNQRLRESMYWPCTGLRRISALQAPRAPRGPSASKTPAQRRGIRTPSTARDRP